jgi:hypothetical protein
VSKVLRFLLVCLAGVAAACGSSSELTTSPSPTRCTVEVRGDGVSFSADGGAGSVRVTTNRECNWSARTDASWVALTPPMAGQGDGSVSFKISPNGDPSSRSAGITVEDQRLQISQEGRPCTFSVSSSVETIGSDGGERTVQIGASSVQCRWSATTDVSWIEIASARDGSGNGAVTIRVAALPSGSRSGTLTIAGNAVGVEQSAASGPGPGPPPPGPGPAPGCEYGLGTLALTFDQSGGVRDVSVSTTRAGCAWSAASPVDWITIPAGQSGSGAGVVRISVATNTGVARSAVVRIADQSLAITQGSGCGITPNPPTVNAAAAATNGTIQVASGAGCVWAATSNAAWVTITEGASGAGSGLVRFSIAANSGPARNAALSIGGRVVPVAQASGCTFSVAPTTIDSPGAGGSSAVSVTTAAGCAWTASNTTEWIALSARSGTGPGQATFSVQANNGPARGGTLTVAGQIVTVNQASPCVWSFIPPFHRFDANGGNGAILVIVTGNCVWEAVSGAPWLNITSGGTGQGNGLVQFVAAPNFGPERVGSLTIAGQRYEVSQAGR